MNHVEKIGELLEREKQRQGRDEFIDNTFHKSQSQTQQELGGSVSLKARVKTAGEATRAH